MLTDTLDANLKYVSATESQGSVTQSGSVVTYSFGTIAVGQTVTATVTAQAFEDGTLNNLVSVTSNLPDPNLSNNTTATTVSVAEPPIVVSGPIHVSGKNQSNVTVATFTHAGGVELASAFVATINWGDNSASTGTITESGTTYTVKGSHTYAKNGSYTVTTTVVESDAMSPHFAMAGSSTGGAASRSDRDGLELSRRAAVGFDKPNQLRFHTCPRRTLREHGRLRSTVGPSSSNVNLAGTEPVPDNDSLDALFELLNGLDSDALHLGKSNGQLT